MPKRPPVGGLVAGLAVALATGCGAAVENLPVSPGGDGDPAACFENLTRTLADDAMEGRGVGTEGLEAAARFLEGAFSGAGLAGGADSYGQTFEVKTGVALGPGNRLSAGGPELTAGEDFTPFGFSSSGEFSGPLVFGGYGIQAAELEYDDYEGIDLQGKVVLALRFEPGEDDSESPFDGRRPSRWSGLRYKAMRAREAGASALVFVSGPETDGGASPADSADSADPADPADDRERLPVLRVDGPTSEAGLPVIQVKRAVASSWLSKNGHDLAELKARIDGSYRPASIELPGVEVSGRVDLVATKATVRNIVGVVPGRGSLSGEALVVGAHYDHLGFGGRGSLRPDETAVHNGADDNASGVAAMLCAMGPLGELLESRGGDRRTLVAVAFAAEEIGLGGSSYYVAHPVRPVSDTIAMVNLDMVGRVTDNRFQALGSESAGEWSEILEPAAEDAGLTLSSGGDGYGPSDQTPFYTAGVPVVHLFSGSHEQYHTPEDDSDRLNVEGGGQVARFLGRMLADLLTRSERLTYQESESGPVMTGDSRGYGAYLGTIPDYSTMMESEGGVLLAGVRKGGPADRAGVRGGDRIVEMAGVGIRNLYDMTFVLRDHRPGDTISIVLEREGERVETNATLGSREKAIDPGADPSHPTGESEGAGSHDSHGGEPHAGSAPPHASPA